MQTKLKQAEIAAREAADRARKAAAYATLWLFIPLLVGVSFRLARRNAHLP